jgi:hypothetical protein
MIEHNWKLLESQDYPDSNWDDYLVFNICANCKMIRYTRFEKPSKYLHQAEHYHFDYWNKEYYFILNSCREEIVRNILL